MEPDKCLGKLEIDVEELLECQHQQGDDGECLHFVKGFHYD
jgi:hypothetical protein